MSSVSYVEDCQCDSLLSVYVDAQEKKDQAYEEYLKAKKELTDYYSERMQQFIDALRAVNNGSPNVDDDYGDLNGDIYDSYLNFLRNRFAEKFSNWEQAEKDFEEIEEYFENCESNYEKCDKCDEYFSKAVSGCIEPCRACGRWYCVNCFDKDIEELEVTIGEAL